MPIELELNQLVNPKRDNLKGSLGITNNTVSVSSRPSFVWVRLLDNPNELIKAHNYKVSPTYNLPVLLEFDGYKYEITGIDTDRYANWATDYPFLPDHGRQHSALRGDEGNDIVWVDSQQFLPLLCSPENSKLTGSNGVYVSPYSYLNSDNLWIQAGGTGMVGFEPLNSSGSNLYLLMLRDSDGSLYSLTGTTIFSSSISGTSDILPYLPTIPADNLDKPVAAIKASSGDQIGWRNIYNLRQFVGASQKALATNTFNGMEENLSSQISGSNSQFTFSNTAEKIWVLLDGVKQKDVIFITGSNTFDLGFSPQTGSHLEVVSLVPALELSNRPIILYSNFSAPVVNTTTEVEICSVSIPGGTLNTNGQIRCKVVANLNHAIVGTLTLRLKYGSTTICSAALLAGSVVPDKLGQIDLYLSAKDTNDQQGLIYASFGDGSALYLVTASGTGIEDSTTTLNLKITAQWGAADAGLSFTAHHVLVESVTL